MSSEIIDDRFLGALHLQALTRNGFAHDPAAEHTAFQVGTLDALMAGGFDGDATIEEVLSHGDLGIGTVEHLGGELVIIEGSALVIDFHGTVYEVTPMTRTPFAVVCSFSPVVRTEVKELEGFGALRDALERSAPAGAEVLAFRLDGQFHGLQLRSVRAQTPPYVSLSEVTRHQSEWQLEEAVGTLVGFRFPDGTAGIEVPGYHIHFISEDRLTGGHVLNVSVSHGVLQIDGASELHVELPEGVGLGEPGAADRAAIRSVEGS
jgi:acetolactate decarboxylase